MRACSAACWWCLESPAEAAGKLITERRQENGTSSPPEAPAPRPVRARAPPGPARPGSTALGRPACRHGRTPSWSPLHGMAEAAGDRDHGHPLGDQPRGMGIPQIVEVQPTVLGPQMGQLGLDQGPLPHADEVVVRQRPGRTSRAARAGEDAVIGPPPTSSRWARNAWTVSWSRASPACRPRSWGSSPPHGRSGGGR
jgi:hypothetical protein